MRLTIKDIYANSLSKKKKLKIKIVINVKLMISLNFWVVFTSHY